MHLDCYFSPPGINNELVIYKSVDLTAVSKCFMWMNWVVLQVMLKYVSLEVVLFRMNEGKRGAMSLLVLILCNGSVKELNSLERHTP